jgi:hypothetical protein
MHIRDWHPRIIVALWIAVLLAEWLVLLVLPFSPLSLPAVVLLPLAGMVLTSWWSAAQFRSSLPQPSVLWRLVRAAAIVVGGGALVAAVAAAVQYALTPSGRESTFGNLVWGAAQIGAMLGGALFLIGFVLTAIQAAIHLIKPRAVGRRGDGAAPTKG